VGRVPPHKDREISKMRLACFKKFFQAPQELAEVKEEYAKFSSCTGEFNDHDSIEDRWSSSPHSWWSNYGQDAPLLMSLAMKLLSQPASSSCCERNWSTYSFVHSVKRNALTPARAENLVFVHSNLRHLSRSDTYKKGETRMWEEIHLNLLVAWEFLKLQTSPLMSLSCRVCLLEMLTLKT